jgi:hypothetical protein
MRAIPYSAASGTVAFHPVSTERVMEPAQIEGGTCRSDGMRSRKVPDQPDSITVSHRRITEDLMATRGSVRGGLCLLQQYAGLIEPQEWGLYHDNVAAIFRQCYHFAKLVSKRRRTDDLRYRGSVGNISSTIHRRISPMPSTSCRYPGWSITMDGH